MSLKQYFQKCKHLSARYKHLSSLMCIAEAMQYLFEYWNHWFTTIFGHLLNLGKPLWTLVLPAFLIEWWFCNKYDHQKQRLDMGSISPSDLCTETLLLWLKNRYFYGMVYLLYLWWTLQDEMNPLNPFRTDCFISLIRDLSHCLLATQKFINLNWTARPPRQSLDRNLQRVISS